MIWLLLVLIIPGGLNERMSTYPCADPAIISEHEPPLPGKPSRYTLYIVTPKGTEYFERLTLKFDTEASLVLLEPDPKKVRVAFNKLSVSRNIFYLILPKEKPISHHTLIAQVTGPATGAIPYLQSVLADDRELCAYPRTGFYANYVVEGDTEESENLIDESCGRRKVVHTELIVNGQPTKSGDWPWHVAISRIDKSDLKYICGGTLLSKSLVLTAAHCVSLRGSGVVPESLSVYLGKHNLNGGDIASQEREVFEVIIHPDFNASTLNNDIALLKLKSEAIFSDYVQPACLWHQDNKLPTENVSATVVGWGFTHRDYLSSTLQQITIPLVSDLDCLKSNPIFFHKRLNTNKFCAGFANGTAVCNGDSGGGLMIFVPDRPGDTSQASGSWYVHGIVSLAPSRYDAAVCDPHQYTIFTDVDKYRDWLADYFN